MLWNNWQVHQGNPSLLGGQTPSAESTAKPSADPATTASTATPAGVPTAPVSPSASADTPSANVPGVAPTAVSQAQLVNFKTDVLSLSFDLQGAQLVRADLLSFPSREEKDQSFVLLNNRGGQTYVVQ